MSSKLIHGIGYDPIVGPRSTDPNEMPTTRPSSPNNAHRQTTLPKGGSTTSGTGAGTAVSIYDRNLHRGKHEIALSSLSFLFMQIVSMNLNKSSSLIEMERKLNNLGYGVGLRALELTSLRESFSNNITSSGKSNTSKREIKILDMLRFIGSSVWKSLFGKAADNLEKSSEDENQFMIIDSDPVLSKYISVPKEYENLDCESFVAGVIEGILDISYFQCEVSAHNVPMTGMPNRTVYLVSLDNSVTRREKRIS